MMRNFIEIMESVDCLGDALTNGSSSSDMNNLTLYDVPILMDARSQWTLNRQIRLNILRINRRQRGHFNYGISHAMREVGVHVSSYGNTSIGNTTHTRLHSVVSVGGELETVSLKHVKINASSMMNKDFNFDSSAGSSGINQFMHEGMSTDGSTSSRVMRYSNVECAMTMLDMRTELQDSYGCNYIMDIDALLVPKLNQQSSQRNLLGHLSCNDILDIDALPVPELNQQSSQRNILGHLRR